MDEYNKYVKVCLKQARMYIKVYLKQTRMLKSQLRSGVVESSY